MKPVPIDKIPPHLRRQRQGSDLNLVATNKLLTEIKGILDKEDTDKGLADKLTAVNASIQKMTEVIIGNHKDMPVSDMTGVERTLKDILRLNKILIDSINEAVKSRPDYKFDIKRDSNDRITAVFAKVEKPKGNA